MSTLTVTVGAIATLFASQFALAANVQQGKVSCNDQANLKRLAPGSEREKFISTCIALNQVQSRADSTPNNRLNPAIPADSINKPAVPTTPSTKTTPVTSSTQTTQTKPSDGKPTKSLQEVCSDKAKNLKGAEHQKFMGNCLKGK